MDDNLGTTSKMRWEAVSAVMDVGREHEIPVATHMFYLEDAKRLLELGTGGGIRVVARVNQFGFVLQRNSPCVAAGTRVLSCFVPDFWSATRHPIARPASSGGL